MEARSSMRSTPTRSGRSSFSPLKIVATSARTLWSPTLVKRRARLHQEGTTGPACPRPTCSGPATRDRPAGSCTARLALAAGVAAGTGPAQGSPTRFTPPAATASLRFTSTRGSPARPRKRWPRPGHRHRPRRAGRLRASHHAAASGRPIRACPGREPDAVVRPSRAHPGDRPGDGRDHASSCRGLPGLRLRTGTSSSRDWQEAFWGANYARLLAVKERYDPRALFLHAPRPGQRPAGAPTDSRVQREPGPAFDGGSRRGNGCGETSG